jgi:hypothetical protein
VSDFRKFVGLLAVFGVLLHAGLIVRHNVSMVASQLGSASQFTFMICHGDGSAATVAANVGMPAEDRGSLDDTCPMCAGFGATAAVLSEPTKIAVRHLPASTSIVAIAEAIAERRAGDRPPTRGPPAFI